MTKTSSMKTIVKAISYQTNEGKVMDVIRRRMLEIETYDFYKQLGGTES